MKIYRVKNGYEINLNDRVYYLESGRLKPIGTGKNWRSSGKLCKQIPPEIRHIVFPLITGASLKNNYDRNVSS